MGLRPQPVIPTRRDAVPLDRYGRLVPGDDVEAVDNAGWGRIAVVVGVLVASVLVGFLSADDPHTFNWEVAAIFGTAAGTLALAVVTWVLASAARRDQELRDRPLVILRVVSLQIQGSEPRRRFVLIVEVHNAGLGPALKVNVHARQAGEPRSLKIDSWLHPVLGPGEPGHMELPISFVPGGSLEVDDMSLGALELHGFEVWGSYTDRGGERTYKLIRYEDLEGPYESP
jgi:hypothetical protein